MENLELERKQIEKAKRNPAAFAPLYEKYHKQIFLYIRKRISSTEEAEDITAQVFEKAIKNLRRFQWQGISLSSWLYRIARNALNDHLRKIQRHSKDDESEEKLEREAGDDAETIDNMIRNERQEEVLNAIGELKEIDQYIVYYKFFENMSNIKIAEAVGISETNVGTRLSRLKEKLKEALED